MRWRHRGDAAQKREQPPAVVASAAAAAAVSAPARARIKEEGGLQAQAARNGKRVADDALGGADVRSGAPQQHAAARVHGAARYDDVAHAPRAAAAAAAGHSSKHVGGLILAGHEQLTHLEPPRCRAEHLRSGELVEVVDARHATRATHAGQALQS